MFCRDYFLKETFKDINWLIVGIDLVDRTHVTKILLNRKMYTIV